MKFWKAGVQVIEEILVIDDSFVGVTGLNVSSDFTKLLSKDGADQPIGGGGGQVPVAIAEIGNGRYSVTWTPTAGQWELTVIQVANKCVLKENYYVTADGPLSKSDIQTDILARLPAALVGGRMDSSVGAMANNVITDAAIATDVDTYQAKIGIADDDAGSADRYTVVWLKNGQPVLSGVTNPKIKVIKVADGADLVSIQNMTEAGTTHVFKYVEASNRIVSGAAYVVQAEADIDGATRKWRQQISRDSV